MAAILIYAGVKSYKKYQKKKKASAENAANLTSTLDIPSTNAVGFEEALNDEQLPAYKEKASSLTAHYTAPYSPDDVGAPANLASPSPATPEMNVCELYGDTPVDNDIENMIELPGDSTFTPSSEVFELAGDDLVAEPMSPAPLHVVKGGSSPLLPHDEESGVSLGRHASQRDSCLEIPESPDELLSFEPPAVPSTSTAMDPRVMSS